MATNGDDPIRQINRRMKLLLDMVENLQKQLDAQGAHNRAMERRIRGLEKQVEALKQQLQDLG